MDAAAQYGLVTPGLTLAGPAEHYQDWERNISVAELVTAVQAADRLGFDHVTCSEHVGIPPDVAEVRGARYYDPLSTLGYLAAKTSRIRLTTYVLVLGYSHPLEIAKRYGTLDKLSGGRLVLGLGVGSLRQEFALLGLGGDDFARRGARGDDALRAIRASFGQPMPEYHGEFYDYAGFIIDPCGVQQHVPIWIGGRSRRSLRRAVELGDGWMPFGLSVAEMAAMIGAAKQTAAWQARAAPPACVLRHDGRIDPIGQPGEAADSIRAARAAGATIVTVDFVRRSLAHYLEQLEALAVLPI